MTKEQLLAEAMALEPAEREQLAEGLWLSISGLTAAEIEAAWVRECRSRIEAVDRGAMGTMPAAEAMQEVRKRLAAR